LRCVASSEAFFLSPANLPAYFSWIDALSFIKYTYIGISLNELTGLKLTCTPAELAVAAGGVCPITSGEQVIQTLGMEKYHMWECALVLLAMILFFRIVAYCAMRWEWLWDYLTWDHISYVWNRRRRQNRDAQKLEGNQNDNQVQ